MLIATALVMATALPGAADSVQESPAQARARHALVAQRRDQAVIVICHRGAQEFAHENTLEAFRATLELGGDGNEVDLRMTKDGVPVCFHDDMLDRLLEAHGVVRDYTWAQLQTFRFRDPGPFGEHCRIPTLREFLLLHRRLAGLIHLDIKESGLDRPIAALLDELDMWDHIAFCNDANAGILKGHPKLKLLRYKAGGLFDGRADVNPEAIAAAIKKPGQSLITDDPRGVLLAAGRKLGTLSKEPVAPLGEVPAKATRMIPSEAELLRTLKDHDDWKQIAETPADQEKSGQRIRARALAAELLLARKSASAEVRVALAERVRNRSLHKHWMYHGFDGAMAMRSLILLRAPEAVETARFVLWRDDPELRKVFNPEFKVPVSWTDFRLQMVIFPALEKNPSAESEKLCRDYLAQTDEQARKFGPPQFEAAAKTLLTIRPTTEVAVELMKDRRGDVRGRAVLVCLKHADERWAREALNRAAPWAVAYLVGNLDQSKNTPSLESLAKTLRADGWRQVTQLAQRKDETITAEWLGDIRARTFSKGTLRFSYVVIGQPIELEPGKEHTTTIDHLYSDDLPREFELASGETVTHLLANKMARRVKTGESSGSTLLKFPSAQHPRKLVVVQGTVEILDDKKRIALCYARVIGFAIFTKEQLTNEIPRLGGTQPLFGAAT